MDHSATSSTVNKHVKVVAATIYTFILLALTFWPSPKVPSLMSNQDLLAHFILYMLLTFFWLLVPIHWTLVIPLVIIFGLFTELVQIFIPGRSFSYLDFTADTLGALSALIFYRLWRKYLS